LFPLWKRDTSRLAQSFVHAGFKAIITCVDGQHLDGSFVGRRFNEQLLADLPPSVDPCGENGEFHSFVYDGPIFTNRVRYRTGATVLRDDRFYYCDLLPSH
jgi:diphthamide synthase (EF-2-diphthine--ammonia ligase)